MASANGGFGDADASPSGVTFGAAGAISGDTAATLNGTSGTDIIVRQLMAAPDTFTISAWIKTVSTSGGKIVSFGNGVGGNSTSYDRQLYLSNTGRLYFNVGGPQAATLGGSAALNDGQWHFVAGSLGSGGMSLYVDGVQVAANTTTTSGDPRGGYWRIGGDNANGLSPRPTSGYLNGSIDEVAIFPKAIGRQAVATEYAASGRGGSLPAKPADTYGAAVYSDDPDIFWRLGESNGTVAKDAGIAMHDGDYFGTSVSLGQAGAVSGVANTAVGLNSTPGNSWVASRDSFSNASAFSVEAWFNTTTTRGGKIIGFGSSRAALSSSYDRHVYMQDDGKLVFGVYNGSIQAITTSGSYNNGAWHHVVGVMGSDGMKMYVDGALVGTNPTATATSYTGYWRVGGDRTWGSSSNYFNGRIDEAAVYSTALSADRITQHYVIGTTGKPANVAPVAAFTVTAAGLDVSVDAT
jgi:hypothetical protein